MGKDALGNVSPSLCRNVKGVVLQPAIRGVQLWSGCARVLLNATGICSGFSDGVGSTRCLLGLSDSSGLCKGAPNDESIVGLFVIYHEFILGLKSSCVG